MGYQLTSIEASEKSEVADGLLAAQVAVGDEMNIQHVSFDPGAVLDEHSHHHEQITFVYDGEFDMIVDGDRHTMAAGDVCVIDGHTPHKVVNESDGVARAVEIFHPARETPPWETED
ncbi:cupin domain-containing protein [Halovenus marina]|uniref:cupin domain-containing protein n=1 Tax=Halovenus marina TaxID=3396621 RepID=UPI003F55B827